MKRGDDQRREDEEPEILDVELDDEAEDILVVELDDEPAELPPVEPPDTEQALAMCARFRRPFLLELRRHGKSWRIVGSRELPQQWQAGSGQASGPRIQGAFDLSAYPGCPYCGAKGLVLCRRCGTLSCSAADPAPNGKGEALLPCPTCGASGPAQPSANLSAPRAWGKGKKA